MHGTHNLFGAVERIFFSVKVSCIPMSHQLTNWLTDWLSRAKRADTKGRLYTSLQISGLIYKVIHVEQRAKYPWSTLPAPLSSLFTPIACSKPGVRHVPEPSVTKTHPVILLIQMSLAYTRIEDHLFSLSTLLHLRFPLGPFLFLRHLFRYYN